MTPPRRRRSRVVRLGARGLRSVVAGVVDGLGEVAIALVALGALVLLAVAVVWGLAVAPLPTVGLLVALVVLVVVGGWRTARGTGGGRSRLGRLAVGTFLLVAAWLAVVLTTVPLRDLT